MKWVAMAVSFYVLGTLAFLMEADFDWYNEVWNSAYFMWSAAKDVLLFGAILALINERYKWIVKPVFIYAIINLLWELTSPITNLSETDPKTVTILFTALILIVIIYLTKDLARRMQKEL